VSVVLFWEDVVPLKVLPPKAVKAAWVERTCKHCQELFYARRAAILHTNASGNFCSRSCYNLWQRTQVGSLSKSYRKIPTVCDECGVVITVTPSKMKKYKNHFCSGGCRGSYYGKQRRRGRTPYGAEWKEARAIALKTQRICAFCASTHNLHIHHIVPWRISHSHAQSNLIPLCRKHHMRIERYSDSILDITSDAGQFLEIFGNILRSAQLASICVLTEIARNNDVEVRVNARRN
jgi:hypothetical protein